MHRHAQGRQPGIEGTVEDKLAGLGRRFALQCGLDPFLHESGFEVFNGASAHAQGFGHFGYFPWAAMLAGTAQQQRSGVDNQGAMPPSFANRKA